MSFPELNHLNNDLQTFESLSSRKKKNTRELPLTPEENNSLLQILDEAKAAEKGGDFSLAAQKYKEYKEAFLALKEEKKGLFTSELSEVYTSTNPDTKKQIIETITLNIEKKLEEFLSFYEKNNVVLPAGFKESMQDIWQRNQEGIREAIAEKGFNDFLLMPGNLPLPDLAEKMKMEKGHWESDSFKEGGSFQGAKSEQVENPRLVLLHNAKELTDRPELAETLNIKGEDVSLDETLTLEDYLVFQKKYCEKTGTHLDEEKYVWLATKSGSRLVHVRWASGLRELRVDADDLDDRSERLGRRLSRSFF